MSGIKRLNPDNVNLEDIEVWKSIRDDTTLIFQWESNSAQQYLKKFMSDSTLDIAKRNNGNFSMLKWLSFGNGLIRPACASFRDSVAKGEFFDNGFKELNDFLSPEAGRVAMQETIMQFLVKFCGYSNSESDNVRRSIAKKKGTEKLLPEIEQRFIKYSSSHYDISEERCEEVIKPFLQIILDASDYSFSWNHSDAYSAIGYICGYLRYYYPLEFLTAALNIFEDNIDKTAEITKYAEKIGITVTPPKWGLSKSGYLFDKEKNRIAKGLTSLKYMNNKVADELLNLYQNKQYKYFVELLNDINLKTSINSRQLEILIKIDFFSDFGNQRKLLMINDWFANKFNHGESKQIKKEMVDGTEIEQIVKKYSTGTTKSGGEAKNYTLLDVISITKGIEDMIMNSDIPDIDSVDKIKWWYEVSGELGFATGLDADRRKLFVTDLKVLKRKSDKRKFGYSVFTKSLGSGKESCFTILNGLFDSNPFDVGDIIYCTNYERNGKYFKLTGFKKIS